MRTGLFLAYRPWLSAEGADRAGAPGGRRGPRLGVGLRGVGAGRVSSRPERFGEGESARRVQGLFPAGDREGAAAALSDGLIEGSAICCRPGELDDRLAAYEAAGASTLLALSLGDRAIVKALA